MSLELVILVPALVLLTLFVLWAGRGGQAGLTADLAAEEAATAAALCCEEGEQFQEDRDALVADILAARPGLQFLCIGGLQPAADPDRLGSTDPEFVQENWLEFEPAAGVSSGGVGVLGVRFTCETDGAVAPLRGLFPTVTFHGQASEVVVRRPPPPDIGFKSSRFIATEGPSGQLVFKVTSLNPVPQEVKVQYQVLGGTAMPGSDYTALTSPLEVTIPRGRDEVEIVVDLIDTGLYEGRRTLILELTDLVDSVGSPLPISVAELDTNRTTAEGWIEDDDAEPYLFIVPITKSPCEVVEADTTLDFEVRLRDQNNTKDAPSAVTVTVQADTADTGTGAGHATAGTDYTALTGNTVTFSSGDVTETVTVTIRDDASSPVAEPDETFKLQLSSPSGAPLGSSAEVTCKIIDDEVRVTVANASADEGNDIQFELRLDRRPTTNFTVSYSFEDYLPGTNPSPAVRGTAASCASAVSGADYLAHSGTAHITAGHDPLVTVPLKVTTCQDDIVEADETFWLKIVPGGEAVAPKPEGAVGTIRNDDVPVISVSPASVQGTEGNTVRLTVTLDDGSGGALQLANNITVDYDFGGTGTDAATDPGPGQVGADYSVTRAGASLPLSGTLTFIAAGPTNQRHFDVELEADYLKEPTEALRLDLSNLTAPAVFEDRDNDPLTDDSYADVEILDDPPPELSVSDFVGDEGTTGVFTVTLAKPRPNETVTVDYVVCGRTGTNTTNCTTAGVSNTMAWAPGVSYYDYDAASGSSLSGKITFTGGATTYDVGVELRLDAIYELNETLRLELSNPTKAVLKDRDTSTAGVQAYGEGTIIDKDAPKLYVDNDSANEGDNLTFAVALCSPVTGEDVTVAFATQTRSATAGLDFTAKSGTLGFPAGYSLDSSVSGLCGPGVTESKSQTVDVATLNDLISESDEEVHLVLSNQTPSVALGKAVGVGRIINVNPATVRVNDPFASEGDNLNFEITLVDDNGDPATIAKPVTVRYATADRTAKSGNDYQAVPQLAVLCLLYLGWQPPSWNCPSVTFSPADNPTQANPDPAGRRHAVAVLTGTDTVVESDETMALVLNLDPNTDNAGLGNAQGIGTILDRPIYIRIDNPAAVDEGDTATFTVGLYDKNRVLASAAETVTVRYATADLTATAGSDYTSDSGTLTFAPGDQEKTIDVATLTDNHTERAETFRVDLSQPTKAILDKAAGVGTINADALPKLSVSDAAIRAGSTMTFTVTLDAASLSNVTVLYTTVDDTATAGSDYALTTGTLTFAAGDTTKTIDVQTFRDSDRNDETFQMLLSGPTNATLDDDTGVGKIVAASPTLRIDDASAQEGQAMQFRVNLNETLHNEVTVDYATVERSGPGAATEGDDYLRASGTLSIPTGDLDAYFDVTINSDSVDEFDETFLVELSNPTNVAISDGTAVGTIEGTRACVDRRNSSTDTLPTASVTGASANEDDGQMDLTITVTEAMCQDYGFEFKVTGDSTWISGTTATFGTDFLQPQKVTLVTGQTTVDFSVPLIDDDVVEGDETFRLVVSSPSLPGLRNLADVDVSPRPKIVDDDVAELQLPAAGTVSVTEGGWMSFVVRLDQPAVSAVTFDYATSDGSAPAAAAGTDYVAASGTATIPAGDLSATVAVRSLQDSLDELDENVNLTVSDVSGASPPDDLTAVGVIIDDDDPPAARVSDASAEEGEKLEFTVTLDAPSDREVTVERATRAGTATADRDYVTLASGDVVFAAGVTSQTVQVDTLADDVVESTETVFLDLSSPDGATLEDSVGLGEILDVTDRRLTVSDASVTEGGTLAFRVSFAGGPSSRDIKVRYKTRAGTATAAVDYDDAYESASQELELLAGSTGAAVLVPTVQDRLDEDNETLELVLSDPESAVIADGTATGLIIDNDPLPALRVGDTDAAEKDPGDPDADDAKATFAISLSEPSGRDVTVAYSTADGTATTCADPSDTTTCNPGDHDYAPAAGSLTIDAGDRQASMDVALVNDDVAESVETFRLRLSGAVNASLDDSEGVARVTDDDGLIQILADDPADVYEGAGASAVFTVRLSRADSTDDVTVDYTTEEATAKAGSDYTTASGTLAFAAGETVKTVTVVLVNDDVEENSETFGLKLSSPSSNAVLGDDRASALILDDDGLPTLSVADAPARTEGSAASFTVTLSRSSARAVTVAYATLADATAGREAAATAGVDYTATSGTATIAARSTAATVTVPTADDSFDESTETFWLRLSSPTGATVLDGTATGTINDNDPLPKLRILDASATEGSSLSFEVRLDAASGRTVRVPWTTKSLSPGPNSATAGDDYTAKSGTLTFLPGTVSGSLEVSSSADDANENDERFLVQLGTPTNAVLDDGAAVGRIIDDDGVPRVSIADASVDEDDGPAVFKVTLNEASGLPVTVSYSTADGTATDPDDYAPDAVRTLTIPAGSTEGEISVAIVDDDLAEGAEDFTVTLANPVNAVIADGAATATGTILDDEGVPRLTISDATECEDGSTPADCQVRVCRAEAPLGWYTLYGPDRCLPILNAPTACQPGACDNDGKIEFAVTLSHASTEETSVRYTTFDGTATSPRDFVATSGTLTIPAGDTSAEIAVTLVDDGTYEHLGRTFRVRLDNPVGVELAAAEAVGTINDDEPVPRVPAAPNSFHAVANEDDGFAEHTVRLTHPSDQTVTVGYSFGDSFWSTRFCGLSRYHPDWRSHNPGVDTTPGTLTFAPGVVEQTIRVPLVDNNLARTGSIQHCDDWINAVYSIRLGSHSNVYPLVHSNSPILSGVGRVWDDEVAPYVETITAPNTLESAGNTVFTVTLNRVLDEHVVATFQTADGTATAAGYDYTSKTQTVRFAPGTTTATISVPILDDNLTEGDETFTLQLVSDSSDSNISHTATQQSGSRTGTVTIIDDEADLEVSVADARANENAGTMLFDVSLTRAGANDVTVDYATADGTGDDGAVAGDDYTATSGTLTIGAGTLGASVNVPIIDDSDDTEDDETFTLTLSNATGGATIAEASATGTIVEDANLPVFTLVDASGIEGTGSQVYLKTRAQSDDVGSPGLKTAIELDVRLIEVPTLGDEAATFGDDFAFCYGGGLGCPVEAREYHVRLEPGWADSKGLNVHFWIEPDDVIEHDERFQFEIINVSGAIFTKSLAWGTILNDDLPIVTVADVSASESDSAVVFTLQLHAPAVEASSLSYATVVRASEGDKAASPGDDYTTTSGTLNFAAGTTTATVSVPIIADTADEYDETFLLQLSKPTNLKFNDAVAVGTITDDDDGWWIDDLSVWENAGPMTFTIERDHTSSNPVTVNYRFGSGGSATGGTSCSTGVDFVWPSGSSTGTVTMPAADKSVTLTVTLCDDTAVEGRENLVVELVGLTGRKTTGIGTIVDDDSTNTD